MDRYSDRSFYSYSWHQSHDQATVLLMVPYNTLEDDMTVVIERNHLVVGVSGHPPIVKGRLYGNVDITESIWQLEPRTSRISGRERTTSTTSTTSTQSSYAFVSDPEISSSFAASLESGQVSDTEEAVAPSPALSSPMSASADERAFPVSHQRHTNSASRSLSPGHVLRSITSSFSSLESLHSPHSGRLLTIYLEKETSIIWPSLIVGPVPISLSPYVLNPVVFDSSHELEHQYNMDPTSLVLIALELFDIRKDREEAFEYFMRAWHQAHVPPATMKLVSQYLPLHMSFELEATQIATTAPRGTTAYYFQCIGGSEGLAQLYLEAGMLHLEGAASSLLSTSYSSLSSIRMPLQSHSSEGGIEAWKHDHQTAEKYFDRARTLQPNLEIPSLPIEGSSRLSEYPEDLKMPSIGINSSGPASVYSGESHYAEPEPPVLRKRRKKEELVLFDDHTTGVDGIDNAWYLYIPGLVGAGTALLVVGVIGALSLSTWRRNQGS